MEHDVCAARCLREGHTYEPERLCLCGKLTSRCAQEEFVLTATAAELDLLLGKLKPAGGEK